MTNLEAARWVRRLHGEQGQAAGVCVFPRPLSFSGRLIVGVG